LLFCKRYIKNGAPQSAVIIPTGISVGDKTVLATVSAHTKKIPPANADVGNVSVRITCGDTEANTSQTYKLTVESDMSINITNPENNSILNHSYQIQFNFTVNKVANCSYKVDDGSYSTPDSISSYNELIHIYQNGIHNITVNCTYSILNTIQTTTFTINDTTAPNITDYSPSGTVSTSTFDLTVTTDENASCRYVPSTEGNITMNYSDMPYNFTDNELSHYKTLTLSNGAYIYSVRW